MLSSTDRIEKKLLLRAPRERVWGAISDAKRFGHWFGIDFPGEFVAGSRLTGTLTPTKVDAASAASQQAYAGKSFEFYIERIEPMRSFAFRWHPYAIEDGVEYSAEPTTLVTFDLESVPGGTQLTIVESGFDAIPLARRADAFESNDEGWTSQARLLEIYVTSETA